jgi:hypothetical protein
LRLSEADVQAIRSLGDNTGSMALKGGNPDHEGVERPDRWALDENLEAIAARWSIDPSQDLVAAH